MARLFGELLFVLIRIFIADLIRQAVLKVCAWLDTKIPGRTTRIVLGGSLGLAAYFIFPIIISIIMGLF